MMNRFILSFILGSCFAWVSYAIWVPLLGKNDRPICQALMINPNTALIVRSQKTEINDLDSILNELKEANIACSQSDRNKVIKCYFLNNKKPDALIDGLDYYFIVLRIKEPINNVNFPVFHSESYQESIDEKIYYYHMQGNDLYEVSLKLLPKEDAKNSMAFELLTKSVNYLAKNNKQNPEGLLKKYCISKSQNEFALTDLGYEQYNTLKGQLFTGNEPENLYFGLAIDQKFTISHQKKKWCLFTKYSCADPSGFSILVRSNKLKKRAATIGIILTKKAPLYEFDNLNTTLMTNHVLVVFPSSSLVPKLKKCRLTFYTNHGLFKQKKVKHRHKKTKPYKSNNKKGRQNNKIKSKKKAITIIEKTSNNDVLYSEQWFFIRTKKDPHFTICSTPINPTTLLGFIKQDCIPSLRRLLKSLRVYNSSNAIIRKIVSFKVGDSGIEIGNNYIVPLILRVNKPFRLGSYPSFYKGKYDSLECKSVVINSKAFRGVTEKKDKLDFVILGSNSLDRSAYINSVTSLNTSDSLYQSKLYTRDGNSFKFSNDFKNSIRIEQLTEKDNFDTKFACAFPPLNKCKIPETDFEFLETSIKPQMICRPSCVWLSSQDSKSQSVVGIALSASVKTIIFTLLDRCVKNPLGCEAVSSKLITEFLDKNKMSYLSTQDVKQEVSIEQAPSFWIQESISKSEEKEVQPLLLFGFKVYLPKHENWEIKGKYFTFKRENNKPVLVIGKRKYTLNKLPEVIGQNCAFEELSCGTKLFIEDGEITSFIFKDGTSIHLYENSIELKGNKRDQKLVVSYKAILNIDLNQKK